MRLENKITFLLAGMAVCFLFLAGALTRLQIFQAEKYRELAMNNRIRRVALSAPRGVIYDRNGYVLAGNRPSYDVELVLDEVRDMQKTAEDLAAVLDIKPEDILRKVKPGRYVPYLPVIVARDVGIEKITRLQETRKDFEGINIAVRSIRHYPHGALAAHALGIVGQISPGEYQRWKKSGYGPQDIIGKTGMEAAFNDVLVGRSGGMQVQVDSRGNKDRVLGYKIPVKGEDLFLTLDLELQKTAEQQLAGKRGAIVALDAISGEVLAMASAPAFDPSVFVESAKSKERAEVLLSSKRALINRAIAGVYPPGSVLKVLIGLAGMESKTLNPSTRYYCNGVFTLGKAKFHCWRKHGHGTLDLEEALKYSCNVYFYHAGLDIGQQRIEAVSRAFGLGERTGIVLPNEYAGVVPGPAWKKSRGLGGWSKGDTVNVSIGQGYFLVTPLQLAAAASALGSGGIWRMPLLIRGKEDEGHAADSRSAPFAREITLDKANVTEMRKAMIRVVNDKDATGYSGHLDNVTIAGKTGTVQTSSDRASKRDHALFAGFAPAENPKLAIAVVVETAGTGGMAAAPVAREMFRQYFKTVSAGNTGT